MTRVGTQHHGAKEKIISVSINSLKMHRDLIVNMMSFDLGTRY